MRVTTKKLVRTIDDEGAARVLRLALLEGTKVLVMRESYKKPVKKVLALSGRGVWLRNCRNGKG